jgi:hypothetical protein
VPLIGQGAPLPPDFPYSGEWLLAPRMFLYRPTEGQRVIPGKAHFTAEVSPNSEHWSFGFDAVYLADQFGVSVADIFAANATGGLTLEDVAANTPTAEDATVKIYTFGLDNRRATDCRMVQ